MSYLRDIVYQYDFEPCGEVVKRDGGAWVDASEAETVVDKLLEEIGNLRTERDEANANFEAMSDELTRVTGEYERVRDELAEAVSEMIGRGEQ